MTAYKINTNLFSAINENIKNPFLVLDQNGNILSANKEASSLLSLDSISSGNIFDIFDGQSSEKINQIIIDVVASKKFFENDVSLLLKNGNEIRIKLIINSYHEDNENFVFCTFREHVNQITQQGAFQLEVNSDDVKNIINHLELVEVLNEIKSLYPFTFIGKEKVRKKINQLDEYFWVKDLNNNLILVNNKFSRSLGLKNSQIEGKPEKLFIHEFLQEFHSSIQNYLKSSLNTIILEGIPVKGISAENYKTIEIPLSDTENNLTAVVGIAFSKAEFNSEIISNEVFEKFLNVVKNISQAFAVIDQLQYFKQVNKEFCKLFNVEVDKLKDKNLDHVALPEIFTEKVKQFIDSPKLEENFELNGLKDQGKQRKGLNTTLSKVFVGKEQFFGVTVLIEETETEFDLEKLIKSRGRMFEVLIKNNPEPIFIYDAENLRFLEVNDKALKLYGYSKDEFLRMDLTDLYTPEDIQTLLDSSRGTEKEGKFIGPYKHKKKDGTFVFVEISRLPFMFNDNEAHFNIIREVSEKLELEKKNQLFKAVFDNTDDMVFITDNSGFITFSNKAVSHWLKRSREDLANTSFTALAKDDDRGTVNTSIFHSNAKDVITLSVGLKKEENNFAEVELTATPVFNYNSEIESFTIIAKPKIKTEPEIREVIKEVEIIKEVPVEVLNQVVVEKPLSVKETPAKNNNKEFLGNVFHEILTPINVIIGFVQELVDGINSPDDDQKEAADIINQNRIRLIDTMNSVMEYSAIQQQAVEMNVSEISITEIIDHLQEETEQMKNSKHIEFAYGRISSSLKFHSDLSKFQSLVVILMNVVSHISKKKKIYFSAFPYEENNFIVTFKDSYSAVSPHIFESLKNIFQKNDSSVIKEFGISKLSAGLAKSLLNLLKGSFEIYQKDGKTDYGFIFPIEYSQQINIAEPEIIEEETPEEQPPQEEKLSAEEKENKQLKEDQKKSETGKSIKKQVPLEQIKDETEEEIFEEVKPDEPEEFLEESEGDFEYQEPVIEHEIDQYDSDDEDDEITEEEAKIISSMEQKTQRQNSGNSSDKLNLSNLSCLYIEDQVDSQILFKVQMKELKEIKFAVSFEEALPLLDTHNFDFIVMDINLQGEYNGLDALKIIHKMPNYENIPIVAVTAYVLPGDKEKFIATGFNDFISKPIFREKIIDSLEKIFLMRL